MFDRFGLNMGSDTHSMYEKYAFSGNREALRKEIDLLIKEFAPDMTFDKLVSEFEKEKKSRAKAIVHKSREIYYFFNILLYAFNYFNLNLDSDTHAKYAEYLNSGNTKALKDEILYIIEKFGPTDMTFTKLEKEFEKDWTYIN